MRYVIFIVLALSLVACNRHEEPTTTRGDLFLLVSKSYVPLMTKEARLFMDEYNKTRVRMEGTTAREAVVALLNDSVQCICINRPLNPEERKVAQDAGINVSSIRLGRDALVLVVNAANPLKNIRLATIRRILDKSITRWNEIPGSHLKGKVEVIYTEKNSGTYELLQQKFFDLKRELVPTMTGPTDTAIVQYIRGNPQALGIVSFASVVDRPKGIRVLAVESADSASAGTYVEPNQANIYEELYPLNYSLYLYLSEKKLGVGSGFATFVMTLMGQQVVQSYGLAPEIVPSRIIQLKSE